MRIHTFELRAPIWGGRKNLKIGIAEFRLRMAELIDVECIYRDKSGGRTFPRIYRIASSKAARFPARRQKGTLIHEIPIEEFEEVKIVAT